jgi:hydrogenase nickel incorporation protein HypA/HybF
MHELSIATSILEAAQRETAMRVGSELRKVAVRIGELAAVDPESLRFSFEALTNDTEFAGTELQIEYIPRTNHCSACDRDFRPEPGEFACPSCGSLETRFVSGDELEIAYLELEEA